MTFHQLVLKWNNTWYCDYWWRRKHNILFNSEQHRNARQIDIAFEFVEDKMSNQAMKKYEDDQEKLKQFKETKRWIVETPEDKEKTDRLFDKLDISSFQ